MRRARILLALTLAGAAASCSQELLAGGETATVRGQATDAPAGNGAASSRSASGAAHLWAARAQTAPTPGTVRFTASLELIDEAGIAVPVTDGSVTSTLRLGAGDVVLLGAREVAVGSYPRARVTFTAVEARLASALGTAATVRVDLAQPLVVEGPVNLRLAAGETEAVRVNLNSAAWLGAAVGGVVPAVVFQEAIRLTASGAQ
jgi:hypothetical protein